ncbi:MAG: hypothetical protein IM606_09965 [Cytophagales bacterium]|jgi:hypothetical protein|nr:hypothetical protein [Cytophagales bacterium]
MLDFIAEYCNLIAESPNKQDAFQKVSDDQIDLAKRIKHLPELADLWPASERIKALGYDPMD